MRALPCLAALILLPAPQEEVADLIRKLGDESIEVREKAAQALIQVGEIAREPLLMALDSASPQTRAVIEAILKRLDIAAEMSRWYPTVPRVSLSGEMTLRQAAAEIEKLGGPPVHCDAWPEEKFRIDVRDRSCWDALESACRASGRRSLICDSRGATLAGDRHVALPSVHDGRIRIHAGSAIEGHSFFIESKKEQVTFQLELRVGWAGPVAPVVTYAVVTSATDDAGKDLTAILMAGQPSVAPYPPPVAGSRGVVLTLGGAGPVDPAVRKIPVLKGVVTLCYRASEEPLVVSLRDKEPAPSLKIVDENLREMRSVDVTMRGSVRAREGFSCSVQFKDLDERLRRHLLEWRMRDKEGRAYPGTHQRTTRMGPMTSVTLDFGRVPEEVEVVSVEMGLPRRLIQIEVPFELKDIRIK